MPRLEGRRQQRPQSSEGPRACRHVVCKISDEVISTSPQAMNEARKEAGPFLVGEIPFWS
ncbi:hypothetical protein GQ600_2702 [Phytophthora cactorum]|nr:hypothetical protein GQ600_2702 [Phytophthora cactorum]